MTSISGDIRAGEANRILARIAYRQRGSVAIFYLAMVGCYLVGGLLGYGVGLGLAVSGLWRNLDPFWSAMVGFILGGLVYVKFCRPWTIRRFRRRMEQRGLKTTAAYRLEVSDAGLLQEAGRVRRTADWAVVTDLFRAKGYWVFLVQMEGWILPSRFFPNQADEKAFISRALEHMSPEARARSDDAEAFASS